MMGMKKRGGSSVNKLVAWVRMQPLKLKMLFVIILMISSLAFLRGFVKNYNKLFVVSESVHAIGIFALVYKLNTLRTCSGMFIFNERTLKSSSFFFRNINICTPVYSTFHVTYVSVVFVLLQN